MRVKTVMMLVQVVTALGVRAATYDATTDWSKVSSAGYRDGTIDLSVAKGWRNDGGVATVTNAVICVDTEEQAGELVYNPAVPTQVQNRQTVEVRFPSVAVGGLPDVPDNTQAAVAAVVDGVVTNWYGLGANGWTKLTGAVPPAEGGCDVRCSFSNDVRKVSYAVNTGSGWTVLVPSGASSAWLPNAAPSASGVTSVVFAGRAALTDVKLTQTGTLTASGTFETRMSERGISAADLNNTAENGNRNWENLVLNLDGTDASAKPVVEPVQSSSASTVTLKLGGVKVDADSADITYTVTASDEIGGAGTTTDPIMYNESAEMNLPQTGVKYYRMNVAVRPK